MQHGGGRLMRKHTHTQETTTVSIFHSDHKRYIKGNYSKEIEKVKIFSFASFLPTLTED